MMNPTPEEEQEIELSIRIISKDIWVKSQSLFRWPYHQGETNSYIGYMGLLYPVLLLTSLDSEFTTRWGVIT